MRINTDSRRLLWIALAGALATHCATPGKTPSRQDSPAVAVIDVRHLDNEESWEITYRLPEPASAVAFHRGAYEFRRSHWAVASPAQVEIRRDHEQDYLWSRTGESFQQVTLKIKTYFENPEKDYQVFIPYSDGGLLFYTGQFDVEPSQCKAAGPCDLANVADSSGKFSTRFVFHPRTSEQLVFLNGVFRGRTDWASNADGTYVYFGNTAPVQTEHVVGVVDSRLPAWLRAQIEELLPQLFALYTERFGTRLNFKPVVFISYGEESDPKRKSFAGGILPGLVQLEFRLPRGFQLEMDRMVPVQASYLIAHESAHLWNAQVFAHEVKGGDWLHEGGADALAWRALRELGIVDDKQFWIEQSQSVSKCLLGLEGRPLKESSRSGASKNFYWCGSTINLLVEGVLRLSRSDVDLFGFWRGVYLKRGDGKYDDVTFLAALDGFGRSEPSKTIIQQMVSGPTDKLEPALRAEFQRLQIQTRVADKPSDGEYQLIAGLHAARAVIAADCGSSARVVGRGVYRVADKGNCKTLTPEQAIAQIGPFSLRTDGLAAYDYLTRTCAGAGRVKVGDERGTVEVGCSAKTLPPRPAYLEVYGFVQQ